MEKVFAIAVPRQRDLVDCIYKEFTEHGVKFLFVTIDKISPEVMLKTTGSSNLLTVTGTKKGKRGKSVTIANASSPGLITKYVNLTVEQAEDVYKSLCGLGIVMEVPPRATGVVSWEVVDNRQRVTVEEMLLDIPVFLNKR